jgi:type II secretory pathway pseudopilin PulG
MRIASRAGFSLVEALIIMTLVGILTAFALPRLRPSETRLVREAAYQLATDLEVIRSRALATRSLTRMVVAPGSSRYDAYLDFNRDLIIDQSGAERDSLAVFRGRTLEGHVVFGRGGAPGVPGFPGAGAVALANSRVDFNSRGLTDPFGSSGAIYLTSSEDPGTVAAVTVNGAGAMRVWTLVNGAWQ